MDLGLEFNSYLRSALTLRRVSSRSKDRKHLPRMLGHPDEITPYLWVHPDEEVVAGLSQRITYLLRSAILIGHL